MCLKQCHEAGKARTITLPPHPTPFLQKRKLIAREVTTGVLQVSVFFITFVVLFWAPDSTDPSPGKQWNYSPVVWLLVLKVSPSWGHTALLVPWEKELSRELKAEKMGDPWERQEVGLPVL